MSRLQRWERLPPCSAGAFTDQPPGAGSTRGSEGAELCPLDTSFWCSQPEAGPAACGARSAKCERE